ncbi:MAG: hypothetical protein LBT21_04520 [Oscillospiraceae bacterium]|jgi:hypothetical protein|nr:hypothetical protein [Oscillospiraceae bacterium]
MSSLKNTQVNTRDKKTKDSSHVAARSLSGPARKLKTLLRRIARMSFDRLRSNLEQVHAQSGRARLIILCDMLWCALRYGVGYLDYNVFGFAFVRGKLRQTYFTMNHNQRLSERVNNAETRALFVDKIRFNAHFAEYLGRDWLDLRTADADDFARFLEGKESFFAKKPDDCGGNGIEKITVTAETDAAALREQLLQNGQTLAEETLRQHPNLDSLNPAGVNTLRLCTVQKDGYARLMYAILRIGSGKSAVDNISAGGMYCPVDAQGVITADAFCDKAFGTLAVHPMTGAEFTGFRVPLFDEAVALALKAAQETPEMGYVGWDAAITPEKPVLVEGNAVPSYDMSQNYRHVGARGGNLPDFEGFWGRI